MNKAELIEYMSVEQKCTKTEAEKIINVFTDTVISVLGKGKEIRLISFGKFYSSRMPAKKGINPKTGQPIKIDAYIQPRFSAGNKLKEACNGKKAET